MNNEKNIIMTVADHAELSSVIACTSKISTRAPFELRLLDKELRRARIVASDNVPPDTITMNSRVELMDIETGERMDLARIAV